MKKILYIFIPIFICSISVGQSLPTWEVIEGDTVNYVDENNMKQGFWQIFGKMRKIQAYQPEQVIEEGNYTNSRKQGLWTKFFPSGKTKSEIEYKNSRPNGAYKTYYENGEIEEEGNWKNNRNTGAFTRRHENGQIAQKFEFKTTGKRDGKQEYFYPNGQLMISAIISDGKEQSVTEYYEDGSLKAEKNFIDGKIDVANTKVYESKTPILEKKPEGVIEVVTVGEDKPNTGDFNGDGQHKMYNGNAQISKDGFFEKYRLIDGMLYQYDKNGILTKIKKYKKGRYIGDAPLPKN